MVFVDTNYFLRFLLDDVDAQHQEAKRLFVDAAQGRIKLFTSVVVFFEIYWVLHSVYGKQKDELKEVLESVLQMRWVKFQHGELLKEAVTRLSELNYDLEDAFNLVYAQGKGAEEFKTFDVKVGRKFTRAGDN